jgi:hypothetical protein
MSTHLPTLKQLQYCSLLPVLPPEGPQTIRGMVW